MNGCGFLMTHKSLLLLQQLMAVRDSGLLLIESTYDFTDTSSKESLQLVRDFLSASLFISRFLDGFCWFCSAYRSSLHTCAVCKSRKLLLQ